MVNVGFLRPSKVLACIFLLQAFIATNTAMDVTKVSGCHNNDVMLNCPSYETVKSNFPSVDLEWKFWQGKPANKWKKLAAIGEGGNKRLFSNNTDFHGRLTIHSNGSLLITSLKPDDEKKYSCQVKPTGGSPKYHLIQLNVSCSGKVTVIKREVCVEDDVLLDCQAKHRTNPRKIKQVTWHKRNVSNSVGDVTWSPIVDSDGFTVKEGDGFTMNEDGSLLLRSQVRDLSEEVSYRCEVSKNVQSPREMHLIVLKNVKCTSMRGKRQAAGLSPIKTCIGQHLLLVCPFLNPANISRVRSLKWRVRRTGSPNHFQPLFHAKAKKAANETVFEQQRLVRNSSRLHDSSVGSIVLGANGTLLIKKVRDVDEGGFECIVKTHHHSEPHRHMIQVKPIACNETKQARKENATLASTTLRLTTIRTSSGRVAMTSAPSKGVHISMATDSAVANMKYTNKKEGTQEIPKNTPTSVSTGRNNQTVNDSSAINGSNRIDAVSPILPTSNSQKTIKTSTSTSTRTMIKPSLQTIKTTTTRVTTVTTFSTASPKQGEVQKEGPVKIADYKNENIVCGGAFSDSFGTFQSPNFPSAYPANSDCKWTIRVPQCFSAVNITIEHFDLEHEESCRRDCVAIHDELENQVGPRHCGMTDSPIEIQVRGRTAVVLFRSDASLQKTGFKISYKGDPGKKSDS